MASQSMKMDMKEVLNAFHPEYAFHAETAKATGAMIHQGRKNWRIKLIMAIIRISIMMSLIISY